MIYIPSYEIETRSGWIVQMCEAGDVQQELNKLLARIEALEAKQEEYEELKHRMEGLDK